MLRCTREQVDGKSIPAHKALYVATVQDSSDTLDQASACPISPGATAAHLPYGSVNHAPHRQLVVGIRLTRPAVGKP